MEKSKIYTRKHVTQKDIARIAGVTQATVSMVINNSNRVNSATQLRVEQAIIKLGYARNQAARNLVTRTNNIMSLVTPDLSHESEQFIMPLIQGLLEGLREDDFLLNFCIQYPGESASDTILRTIYKDRVAGIFILSPYAGETDYIDLLLNEKIPFVLVNRRHENSEVACVTVDHTDIAYRATTYLYQQGHRRIGFINGPLERPSSRARFRGFQMALLENHLDQEPDRIVSGNFQLDGGYRGMKDLLQKGSLTAVFAGNDFQSLGAIQALHEAGLEVPRDIAVIGCDDWEMSCWIRPSLTTIRIPFHEMGLLSAHLLSGLVRKGKIPSRQIILPTHFIKRESA